jgi:hypothetical protein
MGAFMALIPNKSKRLFEEINVDVPAGLKTSDAYDAALYEEIGKPGRGVLVITVICSFKFKEGKDKSGGALGWVGGDKTDFMTKFRTDVPAAWGEQFRITTTSSVPAVTDVGVIFDIKTAEDMSVVSHSHWNLNVTKVGEWKTSSVDSCGGVVWNGEVTLDSLDFRPENKGGPNKQRGAVHEFGHMLGHRDEYPEAKANTNWVADLDAVMNAGEKIRERHYAMFAGWITEQYKVAAHLAREAIDWKVSGTTDVFNAKL